MMPKRIQLKRTKGWRLPPGAISVARPTKWGNPFAVGTPANVSCYGTDGYFHDCMAITLTVANVVEMYRDLMAVRTARYDDLVPEDQVFFDEWRAAVESLRGKDLACWCRLSDPCHADVLLAICNA